MPEVTEPNDSGAQIKTPGPVNHCAPCDCLTSSLLHNTVADGKPRTQKRPPFGACLSPKPPSSLAPTPAMRMRENVHSVEEEKPSEIQHVSLISDPLVCVARVGPVTTSLTLNDFTVAKRKGASL